ncbi:MAG TPA: Ig-like domain-containing protein, partial [Solirubrobacterales bacterium]
MMCRLALAGAVAVMALAAFPAAGSATSIPGPNGKIAFVSGRPSDGVPAPNTGDAGSRIYVADYPSGIPVQVTTLPEAATERHRQPNWSPDHTRIAYAAGLSTGNVYALWILDLRDGSQTEFVSATAGLDRPSWSPDGTKIAYSAGGDLWVKDVDDTNPADKGTQLTGTADTDERPVWSPDGNTLYFNRKGTDVKATRDLYKKSPVTPGGAVQAIVTTATEDDWQPALSPDGKRLCYLRGPQSDAAKLRTVNVDGTSDTPFTGDGLTGALNCVWSPDGTTILYTSGAFGKGELVTRNINAENLEPLTSMNFAEHFDGNADWATNFPPKCDAKDVHIGVNQFVSVTLSCTDPDFGFGAAPPTPTPLEPEAIEIAMGPSHGTIGGISNGKVIYTPDKDFQGTDAFTYTGSDGTSNAVPASVTIQVGNPPAPDTTAPTISGIKLSAKKWRLGNGLAKISKAPVGTTISFNLSETAGATLTFQAAKQGRKSGKKCVKQTSGNRSKPSCTRFVNAGSIEFAARAGQNRVRFQGLITRSRKLALGAYRVVVG